MLNRDILHRGSESSNLPIWVGVVLIAGLLGLAGGVWLDSALLDNSGERISGLQAEIQRLTTEQEQSKATSSDLTQALAEASTLEEELRSQLSDAQAQVASAQEALTRKESEFEALSAVQEQAANLKEQVQALQSQVAVEQGKLAALSEMSDSIEKHRLLLVELRKDPPNTRAESVTYWSNLKGVAARADPGLAASADKVMLRIDNYFDWSDRTPDPTSSSDAYLIWLADYTSSGASAYEEAATSFTKAALLAVITEMDSVASRLK